MPFIPLLFYLYFSIIIVKKYKKIVSPHVIFRVRAPRMVSSPAEGGCFCLATVSVFSLCPGAAQVQETARAI